MVLVSVWFLDEAGEDGDERPHDTEASHDVARRQFLEKNGPWCLEGDVCGVEDGNGGREFLGTCTDGFRHTCCLDIACYNVSLRCLEEAHRCIPMLERSRKHDWQV